MSTIAVPGAPAGADVPGVTIVTESVRLGANAPFGSLTADCPAGQVVIGTGAQLTGASGEAHIVEVKPTEDYVYVAAADDEDGSPWGWTLSAMAICADPLPGYEIIAVHTASSSSDFRSVEAESTGDKRLVGGGGTITGGSGQVVIDDLRPGNHDYVVSAYEDDDGHSGSWYLSAYAICVDQ